MATDGRRTGLVAVLALVAVIAVGVLVAMLLERQHDGDPLAGPTDEPAATATDGPHPSPTPSPTPTPDPHPPLEELELTPEGLGPLQVGVAVEENPGAAMVEWDPDHCAALWEDPASAPEAEAGRWVPSGYPDDDAFWGEGGTPPFGVSVDEDGAVAWIEVRGTTIRTAEGIGLGSSLEDVRAAHPDLEGSFDPEWSSVWWVTGEEGHLVIETMVEQDTLDEVMADGGSPSFTEDMPQEVVGLSALARGGQDPSELQRYGTDWVAGGCL